MGWINDSKAQAALNHAKHAIEKGDKVLVYKFIEAQTNSKATAAMTGMADQIQAIESLGWQLTNMAAAEGKAMTGERVALICLFRLAAQPHQPVPPQQAQQVTWGAGR